MTQDTVLNITLESGVLLEGKVVDDGGQPVPDAQVCAHCLLKSRGKVPSVLKPSLRERLSAPSRPGGVCGHDSARCFPLHPTRRGWRSAVEGVTDLVLAVSRHPMPFVPDDPPKAALISISPPTADGEVTLTGAAGSVAPGSAVVAITLDTGHFTTAQATADGSFTATLFAPAGTSVLIKPTRSARAWRSL